MIDNAEGMSYAVYFGKGCGVMEYLIIMYFLQGVLLYSVSIQDCPSVYLILFYRGFFIGTALLHVC